MNAIAHQFKDQATRLTSDLRHRELVQTALGKYSIVRDKKIALFQDWQGARQRAAEIKWNAVNHLDEYLVELARNLEARGTVVHWAGTAEQARQIITGIARSKNARSVIKSKSMTSEEIHLNGALEKEGIEVTESDLGEFIVQLRHEPPYHIVFPAMHLTRKDISDLFERELKSAPTDSPEELTMIARRVLRQKYVRADIGITGANFAIAETGMISITENEGNARLTAALPKVMITLVGVEKVLPKLEDLALFLPMLATVGAGQTMTGYSTMYGGPRQKGEADGPEEFHVVLLDNRRVELLADAEQRETLHCIRCGGCLNVCPIYRHVGGHTYGTTYCGPIGSVLTPHLRGLKEWSHLTYACSLCVACSEGCPVKIKLHRHMLQTRRNNGAHNPVWWQKIAFKLFAPVANNRFLWSMSIRLGRVGQVFHPLVKGTRLDPAYAWTKTRETPKIAPKSFKQWWRHRK
jgi:L-lactate dehydrogenase complex protein LldF